VHYENLCRYPCSADKRHKIKRAVYKERRREDTRYAREEEIWSFRVVSRFRGSALNCSLSWRSANLARYDPDVLRYKGDGILHRDTTLQTCVWAGGPRQYTE